MSVITLPLWNGQTAEVAARHIVAVQALDPTRCKVWTTGPCFTVRHPAEEIAKQWIEARKGSDG